MVRASAWKTNVPAMQLPVIRMRGRYPADAGRRAASTAMCNKTHSKKAKFTAGIFTMVCPHGTACTCAFLGDVARAV